MASIYGKTHLSLLFLFTLIIFVHAKLNLHHSDHDALLMIKTDLGFNSQRRDMESPCNSAGVICERRISNNSYVLRVTLIAFKSQQLTGFLSPEIGQLSELKELSLPNNYLVDQIPSQLVDCRKLEILNLRNNQFTGNVPPEVSSLVRLRVLDLASNKFFGNLNFLKHFPNLEKLSLENNMFFGKVPATLRSFRNLRFFNISGNSFLEGPVPEMKGVEYSSTELTGENRVRKRYILAEKSTTKYVTSATPPLSSQGWNADPAQAPAPAAAMHKHKKHKRKVGAMILGYLAGALAGSVSGLIFKLLLDLIKGRRKDSIPVKYSGLAIFKSVIKEAKDLAFLKKEDGLANLEVIRQGGCGVVYKAKLPGSNGKMIAIKKITKSPKDAAELTEEDSKLLNTKMRQIKSEIQIVGQIRHRNLLPVLAHVSRPDFHYIVCEYMTNSSLQDILTQVSDGTIELDWLARHKIALGVAAGLEYLHMSLTPRIIHRDLKPANVLLDYDMEARIADFGLAKAVPDANTHVTTSVIAGTMGYIAPEYYQTLKFTDKCDIYSFGVLLGVLVIGKLPSDEFFQHTSEMSLVKWMRNVMTSEDPNRAIDPKLIGNGHEDKMLLVLEIACFCTHNDPKQRPNSRDVRCMLAQIKH